MFPIFMFHKSLDNVLCVKILDATILNSDLQMKENHWKENC